MKRQSCVILAVAAVMSAGLAYADALDRPWFRVEVDHSKPVSALIKECAFDDMHRNDLTDAKFPLRLRKARSTVTIELFRDDQFGELLTEEVVKQLDARGYRPATIDELLSLAKHYPAAQHSYSIVALGSRATGQSGSLWVPYLYGHEGKRYLLIDFAGGNQPRRWATTAPVMHFAAVRKK